MADVNHLLKRWQYAHDERGKYWEIVARQGYNYYSGTGHWSAAEAAILEKENRPVSKINYIFKWMNAYSGNSRQARTDLWVYPREGGDVKMAGVYNHIFNFVARENDLNWLYNMAELDGFLTGQGWLKLFVEFDEDTLESRIGVKTVNPLLMYYDPDSIEYNIDKDAKDVFEAQWIDKEELKNAYPEQGRDIDLIFTDFNKSGKGERDLYINEKKQLVRVLDCYYKTYTKKDFWFNPETGEVKSSEEKGFKKFSQPVKRVAFKRLFGRVELESVKPPYNSSNAAMLDLEREFPYVPLFPYFVKGVGVPLVDQVLSLQDIINKSYSQFQDILNRQPKAGILFEDGAVEDESVLEDFRSGKVIKLEPGTLSQGKIKILDPPQFPAAYAAALSDAVRMGEDILGLTSAFQGQAPGRIESAVGVETLIKQSNVPQNVPSDNLHLTKVILGRKLLKLVGSFWGLRKTLRLLGEDASLIDVDILPAKIKITTRKIDKLKGTITEGSVEEFDNFLNKGKYDLTVDTNKPSITTRQFNLALGIQIAGMITEPTVQIQVLSMIIDMTDFPRKEEFKQVLQTAIQQQGALNEQQLGGLSQQFTNNNQGVPVG